MCPDTKKITSYPEFSVDSLYGIMSDEVLHFLFDYFQLSRQQADNEDNMTVKDYKQWQKMSNQFPLHLKLENEKLVQVPENQMFILYNFKVHSNTPVHTLTIYGCEDDGLEWIADQSDLIFRKPRYQSMYFNDKYDGVEVCFKQLMQALGVQEPEVKLVLEEDR